MRIAVWHNLPSGGGLRALDDQVRALADRGHELHVWSPPAAASFEAINSAATKHVVSLERPNPRGRAVELRSAWLGRRPDLDAFSDHSARCARAMHEVEPDVVLAHPCQFFRVPAIAQYVDPPSVCYLQEPNRRLYEAQFNFPWIAKSPTRTSVRPASVRAFAAEMIRTELPRIQVRSETEWVGGFDEVLVNSRFSRESILRAYGRNTLVCPLGIDTERFALQSRPSELRGTVLFVGAMVMEKNPEFIVRAVAAAGPAVRRFIWVANYVDERCRDEVERTAADVGISVEIQKSVSDQDLLRSFAEADVFVYAPRLEPFGLAPLEANATGLPVVAVAEGGVRETVIDGVNGIVVEHDAEAFGAAVAGLLDDPDGTRALGIAAREHVIEHWSLDASIDRLEAILVAAQS